jgi:hypothetical protein
MLLSFLNIFKMFRKRKNRIVLIKLHVVLSYRKSILNWERLIFSATFYFQVITQMFFLYFFVFQKKQLLGKNNIFGERKSIANIFGSQSVEKKNFQLKKISRSLSNVCYWIKNRLKNITNLYIIVILILAIKIIRDLSLLMGFRTTN